MRLLSPLVCVVLALGLAPGASASDLYQASAPLADTSEAARTAAVTTAFGHVLAQVAGRGGTAALAQQPAGRDAAARALLGYGITQGADGASTLQARFDPGAVRTFLANQHAAMLPGTRPTLLLWLLAQRDGTPAWVGADEPPELAATALQAAAERGLPLLLPVLDLTERANLPASADPGDPASLGALNTAAARYRPDGVLFARLRGGAEHWQVDMRLALPGRDDLTWTAAGTTEATALGAAFDGIGARLAPGAAAMGGPAAPVQIAVDGIDDVAAYARVWEHLGQVPGLRHLQPLALGSGRAVFRFELAGGDGALAASVEPGAPFTRVAGNSPAYRYQP